MPSQVDEPAAQEIMRSHLPAGWKVAHPKSRHYQRMGGECNFSMRIIKCAPVIDDYTLFVFLHEVGHATLHRPQTDYSHVHEFEAERYAAGIFRKRGLRVTRSILREAKANILTHIERDRKNGLRINPVVWKWVNPQAPARDRAKYEKRKAAA